LIVGLGNPYRSDDGIGIEIALRLMNKVPGGVRVAQSSGDLIDLLAIWQGFDNVILIDAMIANNAPGHFRWFDVSLSDLPEDKFPAHSTHAFGLQQAVAMARALDELPRHMHVIGVQASAFTTGTTLTDAVEGTIDAVVASVLTMVNTLEKSYA
jgi:hydrogenase maturation protease